uniref:Secreted protein n=1 Tax=Steinernema glaseri TaxID=37863 RepID=A0A1I8A1K0_9BILA
MKFSLIFLFFIIAMAYACTPLTDRGNPTGTDDAGNQDGGELGNAGVGVPATGPRIILVPEDAQQNR